MVTVKCGIKEHSLKEISVVDSLDSVDPNAALSAKQGKILADIIGDVNTVLESLLGNNA